jgi:hypothetical protein
VNESRAYDDVQYPSAGLPLAHPGHLAAVGRMFGCEPAPLGACRYLEIGCGDATHLIACAVGMPHAQFVGLDLSATAVGRGRQLISQLGLNNVTLQIADLASWTPPTEPFHFVVAHGVYSWVAPPVRDQLLALMASVLTSDGLAYVSYNTYPGCYMRRMVWEMMQYHAAPAVTPAEKMDRALELVRLLQSGRADDTVSAANTAFLDLELKTLLDSREPWLLFHDDLADINEPTYFHQFVRHAEKFGFRFVAEAHQDSMNIQTFPPATASYLQELAHRDVLLKEQYLDFLRLRRFRETLLCSNRTTPGKHPNPDMIRHLLLSCCARPDNPSIDLTSALPLGFRTASGASVNVDQGVSKAALLELADCWPGRISLGALLSGCAGRLGRLVLPTETVYLASFLSNAWMYGLVQLHAHCPAYCQNVSPRPLASPLVRAQLRHGTQATSVFLENLRFDDITIRALLLLLDGTRDVSQLVADLRDVFPPEQRPEPHALKARIERNLPQLAAHGLLVG